MKGRRPETLTADRGRGRPRQVGDSMQRLTTDASGVVAFVRVTEWSRQVLKVAHGRRLPRFHHFMHRAWTNLYGIIFVNVPVTSSGAREDRLYRNRACIFPFQRGPWCPSITTTFPCQVSVPLTGVVHDSRAPCSEGRYQGPWIEFNPPHFPRNLRYVLSVSNPKDKQTKNAIYWSVIWLRKSFK